MSTRTIKLKLEDYNLLKELVDEADPTPSLASMLGYCIRTTKDKLSKKKTPVMR